MISGKKILKTTLTLFLVVMIPTFNFVGCKTKDNSSSSEFISDEIVDSTLGDSGTTEPEIPVTPEVPVEPELPAIPYDRIEDLLSELSLGNYTFDKQTEQGKTSYLIDNDLVFTKSSTDEYGHYYSYENGKMYKIVFVEDEEKYHKYDEKELLSFDNFIYDTLVSTNWTAFDEAEDVVSGNVGELDYSLDLTDKTLSGELSGKIYDINSTVVMKPSYIVDKTEKDPVIDPDNPEIDPPVVQSENIYEVVDGKYVFNIVAIRDVILNWMKGDNQYGKDFLAAKHYSNSVTEDIIYVNADTSRFEWGYRYANENNEKIFQRAYIDNAKLYQNILDGTIKTKSQFADFMFDIVKAQLNPIDTVAIDSNVNEENFEILTQRVFNRLENKGVQANSINNDLPETKLAGFSDAEVLCGFKATSSITSAAFDMGFKKTWSQYYLIKYCGEVELVEIKVSSSVNDTSDELKHVLENNSGKWMINEITRKECALDNELLYQKDTVATASVHPVIQEKKRELI